MTIKLEGVNMIDVDEGEWFGCSDCFFQAETPLTCPDGTVIWQPIYRSETIMERLNPRWQRAEMVIDDPDQPIRFRILDWEKSLKHQPMGYFMASVNQLLEAKMPVDRTRKEDGTLDLSSSSQKISTFTPQDDTGKAFGTIVVTDVEFCEAPKKKSSALKLTLEAVDLANMLGFFVSAQDPFFVVETPLRRFDSNGNSSVHWKKVYQSDPLDDQDELRWDPCSLDLKELCQNNIDKPIRISFFDEAETGPPHTSMGYTITSVRQLLRSKARRLRKEETKKKGPKWDLTKALFLTNEDGQEFGQAVVVDVEMITL